MKESSGGISEYSGKGGVGGDKPIQERTSVYFNHILRKDSLSRRVDELPPEVVEEFNDQVRLAFTEEGDIMVRRIRYLIPYILQAIDWDEYGLPLEAWQLRYYYQRERFVAKTGLSYKKFLEHAPLQQAITDLGLDPEPTFEFILFLKYYFGMRSELCYSSIEMLENAQKALEEADSSCNISLDVNIGGKHYRFSNSRFVKEMLSGIDKGRLVASDFINDFSQGGFRDKIRAIDYFIIKTLLDYLPVTAEHHKSGAFNQGERNFGLSVLSFIGRLPDVDREGECSKENNATFDKLMRDFRGTPIPFAMELFL